MTTFRDVRDAIKHIFKQEPDVCMTVKQILWRLSYLDVANSYDIRDVKSTLVDFHKDNRVRYLGHGFESLSDTYVFDVTPQFENKEVSVA